MREQDEQDGEEIRKYVYLLFKDKHDDKTPFGSYNTTLDRLARDERDKLSKAVVLWNPPVKYNFCGTLNEEDEDEDEEEFKYSDHKDFLKANCTQANDDGIIIEEVFDEGSCNSDTVQSPANNEQSYADPDDVMLE